jgi:polyphosphate kinase 2 (PPK2 family)
MIILFEGWTGSGKRAALKQLVGSLDPTHVRVISVGGASEADDDRHWLAPFWSRIPAAGDTTIFYRSWYRRIVEERVNGKLDDKRWARACDEVNEFEAQQRDHGTLLVKLFFHVTAERQAANLQERQEDPWRRHLLSQEAVAGLSHRERNLEVLHDLFAHTDTRWAPWKVIDSNDELGGCLTALTVIAELMEKAMPAEPPSVGETVVQFRQSRKPEPSRV